MLAYVCVCVYVCMVCACMYISHIRQSWTPLEAVCFETPHPLLYMSKTSENKPTGAGSVLNDSLAISLAEKKYLHKNIYVFLGTMCEKAYLHHSIWMS